MRVYPVPSPPAVAPIDAHAADAAAEQNRFAENTACSSEIIRSAQEARSVQIRGQFIKNMPGWLRAKLLEQLENTTIEDLCIFARKVLSIHNLCTKDASVMDAFNEMGPSVTDTLVIALTKLSTTQEAMDNRSFEMVRKVRRTQYYFNKSVTEDFHRTFNGLSGKIKTRAVIHLVNSHYRIYFNHKIRFLFSSQ